MRYWIIATKKRPRLTEGDPLECYLTKFSAECSRPYYENTAGMDIYPVDIKFIKKPQTTNPVRKGDKK
jgi:hypothetical protein